MIKKITLIGALFLGLLSGLNSQVIVSEGFETGLINWQSAAGNTNAFASDTTFFHNGSKSVWDAYTASSVDTLFQTGVVDLTSATNPQLIFWQICKLEGGYDDGKLYISTDSGLTYTLIPGSSYLGGAIGPDGYSAAGHFDEDSYPLWGTTTAPALNSWWKRESFSLGAYTSFTNVKIMFVLESDGSIQRDGWHIDDISIESVPCPLPTGLTAYGITSDSANVTWITGTTDTLWQVEYGVTGFTLGAGTRTLFSTDDSVSISGLIDNTTYDFYVRNICVAGDTSSWQGSQRFTTLCITDTIPYLMDFAVWPPACWDLTGGVNNWDGFTGHARANFYSISSGDYHMTTQPIYINAHSRIKFEWSHLYDAFYPNDSARVEVKFDTSSTWTEIWGKGQSRFESNDGAGTTVPGTFVSESINLDSATYMNKNIMVRIVGISGYGPHFFIDNVIVEEIPSCPEPTLLSHHALFSDSVALNWVNGLADNMWQIQYGSNGFTLGTGTTITNNNDSIAIGGLTPQTTYDVYLRSICTVGDSSIWIGPYTFTTPCSFYTPPYSEDFTSYSFSANPACWEEATGQLTVASTLTFGTSNWGDRASFANNGLGNKSAVINIFSTGVFEWLISPSIDLGTGSTPYQVEFDVAITDYFNATAPSAGGLMGSDDKLVLVISTDNGVTWSDTNILEQWDTSNMPTFTGDYFYYNLTANGYTGKVRFGLYGETTISNEDNDAFIDNFAVVQVPTCPRPQKLSASSTTQTSANLTWTNGASDSTWIFEYGPVGFTQGSGTISTSTTNPATISGLTNSTCYDVYMRSFCDVADTSLWIGPSKFCTQCAPVVDLCEDFETTSGGDLPICWSSFINTTGSSVVEVKTFGAYSGSNAVQLYSGSAGSGTVLMLISPEMTALTAMTHRANFWLNGDDTAVIIGTMTNPLNPATFTPWDTLAVTNTYQNYKVSFDTYTGTDKHIAFLYAPSSTFDDMTIDEFCFEAIPSCEKAPSVAVLNDGVDSTSLDIGWNLDTALHHTKYMVAYGPAGYVPGDGTNIDTLYSTINFLSIGGLNSLTEYCIWVKAICANGDTSYWSGPHCGKTGCASSTPLPYFEDFATYTPQCWEEMQGVLGTSNTTFTNITTSNWAADDFGNVVANGKSAKINLYSTGRDEWLISPSIDLGSSPNRHIRIEFDVALTDFGNATAGIFGADDSLALVISRDNGATWNTANILALFDTGNAPSNTGDHIVIDLPNETGVVKFGFYAASSVSNEDNDLFIDNFRVYDSVFAGVEEISLEEQFKVYPNPNNGTFTVLNEGNSLKSNIKLVDVQGRLVYEESVYFGAKGRKLINLSNLNAGVYVLLIQSEGKQEQHRLIIE